MKRMAYSIAIREALVEEMERDSGVFLMGEDIANYGGCFGVTRGMLQKFGRDRVRDTPISENSVVGVGLGAALLGLRPVVEIMFMDFVTLAMDQIVNHIAKFHYVYAGQVRVPIVIRMPSGGGKGYGATHSQVLDAWFLNVPGLKVVAPAFPNDAKGLLKSAIRDDNPVIFIESKSLYSMMGETDEGDHLTPIGRANLIHEGNDITLISYSRMVHEALKAAECLARSDIGCDVIDLRTLYPLDMATIWASVRKTGRALIVEEGVQRWGVGAEISCQITEHCFKRLLAPVSRVGAPDIPIPCAFALEEQILPSALTIEARVKEIMQNTDRLLCLGDAK